MVLLGAVTSELIRAGIATQYDYNREYEPGFARYFFHSQTVYDEIKAVKAQYDDEVERFRESPEWTAVTSLDAKNRAQFETLAKLVNILISIGGVSAFLYLRRWEHGFSRRQLISLLFGLFFMKDVVLHTMEASLRMMFCNDAAIWQHFGLPLYLSATIYAIVGAVCLLVLLLLVPPKARLKLIAYGGVGTILGLLAWVAVVGPFLLG